MQAKREPKDEIADAIAIVGMSGKYPDAPDLKTYWDNLARAKTPFATSRFPAGM